MPVGLGMCLQERVRESSESESPQDARMVPAELGMDSGYISIQWLLPVCQSLCHNDDSCCVLRKGQQEPEKYKAH